MNLRFFAVTVLLLFCLTACTSYSAKSNWQPPRSLGLDIPSRRASLDDATLQHLAEPTGDLTLREALTQGLMKNPELLAYSWQIRIEEAKTLQASLPPNPEVGIEVENFGGPGELRGLRGSESTVSLSQLVQLGGKRMKRTQVAALSRDLASWDYETKRLDVLTDITLAYIDVLTSQERILLQQELISIAQQIADTVAERVKAGKVSPLEESKAKVALYNNQISLARAQRNLNAAKLLLAALWGSASAEFETVTGTLDDIHDIPSANALAKQISNNPDIARWAMEMQWRKVNVELEEARAIPDIEVSGGVRRFEDSNNSAFLLGLSLPIPLFDRNQGGRLEAKYNLAKAKEERLAQEMHVRMALAEAYASLSGTYTESTIIKQDLLPGAKNAFEAAQEGYRQGKFAYLDALDAQRTFFEVREQYIESLSEFHKATATIERLIGQPLNSLQEDN